MHYGRVRSLSGYVFDEQDSMLNLLTNFQSSTLSNLKLILKAEPEPDSPTSCRLERRKRRIIQVISTTRQRMRGTSEPDPDANRLSCESENVIIEE